MKEDYKETWVRANETRVRVHKLLDDLMEDTLTRLERQETKKKIWESLIKYDELHNELRRLKEAKEKEGSLS